MIKIALIGSDSTHTEAFASLINGKDAIFSKDAHIVSIWGEDQEQTVSKASSLGINHVAASSSEALDEVDFVMVIGRYADSHFTPTKEALDKGIPTFVDKPFTMSIEQANELAVIADINKTKLCSSSPLRFAKEVIKLKSELYSSTSEWSSVIVTVPANCTDLGPDPRLNSAFFYGIHGIEVLLELVGHEFKTYNIEYGVTVISVHIELLSERTVVFQLIRNTLEFYQISYCSNTKTEMTNILLDESYYKTELDYLLSQFIPGKSTIPIQSTITAVKILSEIDENDPYRKI